MTEVPQRGEPLANSCCASANFLHRYCESWTTSAFNRLACALSAISLAGCASLQGYPRPPEPQLVIDTKRVQFFGLHADDAYYAATSDGERQRIRGQLVFGKMEILE